MTHLTLDRRALASLREAHAKAQAERAEQFTWRGHVLVTAYAGYLIQYAEARLGAPAFLRRER